MLNIFQSDIKKTTQFIAVATLVATTQLVGCSKPQDKKTETTKTETTKTETKTTTIDCTSPNVVSSIQQALTTQIAQQATNTVQQLGQQAGLDVANVTMNNTMAQLMVNVQNIKPVAGQADQCQGTVSITLPEADVANANQIAASLNQPTLVQRLNGKGLSLENNTIIAQNVGFRLTPNTGNFTATSISADSVINEVSNVLANSQLKQMMVQYNPTTNTTTTNSAATAAAGAAVGAATTTAVTRSYNRPNPVKPQSGKSQPATAKPKATNTDTTKTKTTETASTQTLTDSSTKTVSKTNTTTTPTTTTTKTTTPTNTKTTSIEKSVTTKAVPNDNTKLTIEEKNEKY